MPFSSTRSVDAADYNTSVALFVLFKFVINVLYSQPESWTLGRPNVRITVASSSSPLLVPRGHCRDIEYIQGGMKT